MDHKFTRIIPAITLQSGCTNTNLWDSCKRRRKSRGDGTYD